MKQILNYGYWSNYSCAARPWVIAEATIAIGIIISILAISYIAAKVPKTYARLGVLSTVGASLFCLALMVIVAILARTTTMVFVEDDTIIRTSCWGMQPYQESSPLNHVSSRIFMSGRYNDVPKLIIKWPNQIGLVTIDLENESVQELVNTAIVAPTQIAQYLNTLTSKGYSLPPELQKLHDDNPPPEKRHE
jgi:hypothetical protein